MVVGESEGLSAAGTNSISRFEFVCAFEIESVCASVVFYDEGHEETVAAAPIA